MELGIKGYKELTVTDDMLAKNVGSGLVAVYATPMMIAGIEGTAAESVAPYLEEGRTRVRACIIRRECSRACMIPPLSMITAVSEPW